MAAVVLGCKCGCSFLLGTEGCDGTAALKVNSTNVPGIPLAPSKEQSLTVTIEDSQDAFVLERLQSLGITLKSEWDTLAFVFRHAASLGTAAQIAQFIGYEKAEIAVALRRLEAMGLIQRSRVSQGLRFYQISATLEPCRLSCLRELISLTQDRAGRLVVIRLLLIQEPQNRRDKGLHLT